jgi:transposase-like protein
MFLERGFEFTHETVREWEARFAPLITAQLRLERKRDWKRKAVSSWHCDETYLKIKGH